jgi:asparagine synthase (glutamine-hydrolysing)
MKQLIAFCNNNRNSTINSNMASMFTDPAVMPDLPLRWVFQKDNVFLSIVSNQAIDKNIYQSRDFILICNTDLLGSGDCDDFTEAQTNPAAYLAKRYAQHGNAFAKDLHGWFGVILYDFRSNSLKAVNDHFGVRRIAYSLTSESLAIATKLQLLKLLPAIRLEIDPMAVAEYIQYSCIPAPRTIYKGINKLEPAHILDSSIAKPPQAYWDMHYIEDNAQKEDFWTKQTFAEIERAVSLHAKTSDKNQILGCFLSGGTDSSSVSGLVGKITGNPANTFSIGFDDPRYNEIGYARIAASHFNTNQHEYFVTPNDILDLIPKAVSSFDEPFGNASIIPAYYCAKLAINNRVTHMLAGDGGDELFGGNQRYADDRIFQRYSAIPRFLRKYLIEPSIRSVPFRNKLRLLNRAHRYIRRANIPPPDRWHSYSFLSSAPIQNVFDSGFLQLIKNSNTLMPARRHFKSAPTSNTLNRWLYHELKIVITDDDLHKVTSMTELAGVVPRYPLLDFGLAEFTGIIPANLKVSGKRLRYIFKKAMTGFLPQEILTKQKHGFGLPYSVWLGESRPLHDFTFDILGSKQCRERGYFQKNLIDRLWMSYKTDSLTYFGDIIWLFLILEYWLSLNANDSSLLRD